MPTAAGPNTFGEENLVFGYDTGDTVNSYKGEPATNLITSGLPGYFGSGGETLYQERLYGLKSDSGVFQRNFVTNVNTGNNAGLYKTFNSQTLSSSTEYLQVSFDFYLITPYVRSGYATTGLNGYIRIQATDSSLDSYGWDTRYSNGSGDDWNNSSEYVGKWQKVSLIIDIRDDKTPQEINAMYIYMDFAIQGEGIFTNFIITEHASLPTGPVRYTEGTRSVTQGLIDITGNSTIDLTNVSFDSNAQMTFDGTDDGIDLTGNILNVDSFTVEAIVNITSDGNYNKPIFVAGDLSSTGIWFFKHRSGLGNRLVMHGYDGVNPRIDVDSVNQVPDAQSTYVAVTFDGSAYQLYMNGEPEDSPVVDNKVGATTSNYIGKQGGTSLDGDIPMMKVYNRGLSAKEIKANYNAIKGRFNI